MIPITNNSKILGFLCDNPILLKSHNDKYTELFGKAKRFHIFNYYQNKFTTIFNGIEYDIYSKKGKGTSIEINANFDDVWKGKYNDDIIGFLNDLINKLKDE